MLGVYGMDASPRILHERAKTFYVSALVQLRTNDIHHPWKMPIMGLFEQCATVQCICARAITYERYTSSMEDAYHGLIRAMRFCSVHLHKKHSVRSPSVPIACTTYCVPRSIWRALAFDQSETPYFAESTNWHLVHAGEQRH